MSEMITTRRAVVGGIAAATVGTAGAAALIKGGDAASSSSGLITVLDGKAPTIPATSTQFANAWTRQVGQLVSLTSPTGVYKALVSSVVAGNDSGRRPANLRQQSYTVYLQITGRGGVPPTDKIYDLDRSIDGSSKIFITRGPDVAGAALMLAVFN